MQDETRHWFIILSKLRKRSFSDFFFLYSHSGLSSSCPISTWYCPVEIKEPRKEEGRLNPNQGIQAVTVAHCGRLVFCFCFLFFSVYFHSQCVTSNSHGPNPRQEHWKPFSWPELHLTVQSSQRFCGDYRRNLFFSFSFFNTLRCRQNCDGFGTGWHFVFWGKQNKGFHSFHKSGWKEEWTVWLAKEWPTLLSCSQLKEH